jgi:phosphopantetheinyl transferase
MKPHAAHTDLNGDSGAARARLRGTVEVWLANPDALPQDLAAPLLQAMQGQPGSGLSAAELQRLHSLHFAADRRLYGAAHLLLRQVLGHYLARPAARQPQALQFRNNVYGRPELATRNATRRHPLRFSLSHTPGLVAVAVARGCDVGVDVERLRPGLPLDELTPGMLSAVERHWFSALPPGERAAAFTGLWTLKESLLKAHGVGIGEDLCNIGLVRSWQQPQAVLVAGAPLCQPGPAGVVLAQLADGCALAVSALAPLAWCTDGLPQHPGTRRVVLHDLRPGATAPQRHASLPVRCVETARAG